MPAGRFFAARGGVKIPQCKPQVNRLVLFRHYFIGQ